MYIYTCSVYTRIYIHRYMCIHTCTCVYIYIQCIYAHSYARTHYMGAIIGLYYKHGVGGWLGAPQRVKFTSSGNTGMQHRRTSTSGISASYLQILLLQFKAISFCKTLPCYSIIIIYSNVETLACILRTSMHLGRAKY